MQRIMMAIDSANIMSRAMIGSIDKYAKKNTILLVLKYIG
jgi:hypothetical protein